MEALVQSEEESAVINPFDIFFTGTKFQTRKQGMILGPVKPKSSNYRYFGSIQSGNE